MKSTETVLWLFKYNKVNTARKIIARDFLKLPKLYYYYLALSYCVENKYAEAAGYFELSKLNGLKSYLLSYNLGVVYMENKNYMKSITYFTEAINLNKYYVKSYINLAIAFEKLGDLKGALRVIKLGMSNCSSIDQFDKIEKRLIKCLI